jgi:UDP-GlcNAc:undecaprenyl-phosphate GlcNAc-1-phosphate transferase
VRNPLDDEAEADQVTAVFLTAVALSAAGVALVLPLLRRAQVVDVPNARSSHRAPTPRGGGIAVVGALLAASLVGWTLNVEVPWTILGAVAVFALIGFVDDLRGLNVGVRLALQLLLSAGVAAAVLSAGEVSALVLLVTTVALTAYTNAFNFMDGVNGISALNAGLAGGWFAFLGLTYQNGSLTALGFAIAGASLGFLPWNAPHARVFLGDVGSYGLGSAVAAASLLAWSAGIPLLLAVAPLTVYGADTGWALLKRIWGRRRWHEAHREHVYQRLTDAGWPHLASGALPAVFGVAICLLALQINSVPILVVAAALALLAYLSIPRLVVHEDSTPASRRGMSTVGARSE